MKLFKWVMGFVFTFSLIIAVLISSVEIAVYFDSGFFEKEYLKYEVTKDVNMEIEDLLYVTNEMMDYLRGNRENLNVITIVNGAERDFFNEKEKSHMEDVQDLFLKAINIRLACIIIVVLCVIIFIVLKWRFAVLAKIFRIGSSLLLGIMVLATAIVATNFNKYFTLFHETFFDNDLWILDPATDLLINIVPEGFFIDTSIRIIVIFSVLMAICFLTSMVFSRKN